MSAISDSQERQTENSIQNIPTIITSQNNKRLATKLNQKTQIPVKRLHESSESDRMKRERSHKIVLIGDSHIKGLSSELKHRLGDLYVILGFAKPNANVRELKDTIKNEVNKLTKDDVLVFWGGTNDVSKNNAAKGLSQEITYLGKNQQTNCLVITVPHRFDINSNSWENFEIGVFNRKLTKRVESLNNVVLVNSPKEREYFTRHGLHLNKRGKEKMAEKLASSIYQIMEPVKKHSEAIPMPLNEMVPIHQNQELETAQINFLSLDGMKQSELSPITGNDNLPAQLNKERETTQSNPIPTGGIRQDIDDIEINVDEAVDNMRGNLSLLMGDVNVKSDYNSGNTKDIATVSGETGCSENNGSLPKRDRKCLKTKSEDFLWF